MANTTRVGYLNIRIHSPKGQVLAADRVLNKMRTAINALDLEGCHVTVGSQIRDDSEDWFDPKSVKGG